MSSIEDPPCHSARRGARARAPTLLGAALALLTGLAALALHFPTHSDRASPAPAPRPPPGSTQPAASPATGPDLRAGVAARLREILRVREEAFGRRDMRLLEAVYATDCPCLRSGRAAIARLLTDRALWRGRAVAAEVLSAERMSDRLWVAVALLSSAAFRIEREDGALIRAVPAERRRYRFVLVRPAPSDRWLLGDASLLEGGGR